MAEEIDLQGLLAMAQVKIELGKRLVKDLNQIVHVDGVKKVQRKINQEISCLSQVSVRSDHFLFYFINPPRLFQKVADESIQINNITCSNLLHFESLCKILLECHGLLYVDYALPIDHRNSPLRIDAVCDNGATWIKVIARNSRSIEDAVHGRTSYGTKSIVDQAEEYVEASSTNLHMFKQPQIYFIFHSSINQELIGMLEATGVQVSALNDFQSDASQWYSKQLEGVETLNLDITTLLAYVSALTNPQPEHEGCYWHFPEPLLTEQSKWEVRSPVKPVLDAIFESRKLICCETARDSFMDIILLLGGENEKRRTDELLAKVEVLPDVETMGQELAQLKIGGRIKPRSLKIFAFGVHHKAVTVTSNEGFIRAARMQGVDVPVFVHEARALTEEKEANGKRIRL